MNVEQLKKLETEKNDLLKIQSQIDSEREIEQAKQTIYQQDELTAKIEEIQQKQREKEIQLEIEKQQKIKDLNKAQFDNYVNEGNKALQNLLNSYNEFANKRSEKEQTALQRDIDKRQTSIQRQSELAQKGVANQLAFEESQLAKSELKKKELEQKQAREQRGIELVKSYFNFLNARLTKPDADPNTAPFKAVQDVALSEGVAKGIAGVTGFIEGTDMVERDMQGYKYSNNQDGYVARFDGKEAIIPPKENLENRSAVKSLVNGTFKDNFIPISQLQEASRNIQRGTAENIYNSILVQQNNKILSTLEEIASKPVQQVDVDGFKNLIETVHYSNSIAITTHKTSRRRL